MTIVQSNKADQLRLNFSSPIVANIVGQCKQPKAAKRLEILTFFR